MTKPAPKKPGPVLFVGLLLLALPIGGYFAYPILNPPAVEPSASGAATLEAQAEAELAPEARRPLIPPLEARPASFERDAGAAPNFSVLLGNKPPKSPPLELEVLPRLEPMTPNLGGIPASAASNLGIDAAWFDRSGAISGVIRYRGAPQPPARVDMRKDPACVRENPEGLWSEVSIDDGKLAGVLVHAFLADIAMDGFPIRSEEVVLDQEGCLYAPRLVAVQAGQALTIKNSDPTLHNIHGTPKKGEFNQAMPNQGSSLRKTFPTGTGTFDVRCEVHPWMHASVAVIDDSYFAITGKDGSFQLKGLYPDLEYTVVFFHPTLGEQRRKVLLEAGELATLEVDFP